MTNYKFQNPVKIALWQHFMDNVVAFTQFIILKLFIMFSLVPQPILSPISISSLLFVIHKAPISRDEIMKLKIKDENKRCLNCFWWHTWETSLKKKFTLFMTVYFWVSLLLMIVMFFKIRFNFVKLFNPSTWKK
jgi:hypothetical protein